MDKSKALRTLLLVACASACLITAVSRLSAETTADPCAPPSELSTAVAKGYPQSHVEGLADLTDEHRKRFRAEEGARYPGLLPLDFCGGQQANAGAHPGVTGEGGPGGGAPGRLRLGITSLESFDRSSPPQPPSTLISVVKPGKYRDGYEKKTIRAAHPAIFFGACDAYAFVYAWTGRQVEKVCLHD